jgi:ATP-binding cassette subfamily B protein
VEVGTHDALMAAEGAYFNLYQAQARNMDVDMDDDRRRNVRVDNVKDDK